MKSALEPDPGRFSEHSMLGVSLTAIGFPDPSGVVT